MFGRHRWPNSKKTYEGTVCSLVAQIIVLTGLWQFFTVHALTSQVITVIVVLSASSALIETLTVSHVDNLVLPLLQYLITIPIVAQ